MNYSREYLPPRSGSHTSVCGVYGSVSTSALTDTHRSCVQIWPKHDAWILPACRQGSPLPQHNKPINPPAANTNRRVHTGDVHMHVHVHNIPHTLTYT